MNERQQQGLASREAIRIKEEQRQIDAAWQAYESGIEDSNFVTREAFAAGYCAGLREKRRSPMVALTPVDDDGMAAIDIVRPDSWFSITVDPAGFPMWHVRLPDGQCQSGRLDDVAGLRHWMERINAQR